MGRFNLKDGQDFDVVNQRATEFYTSIKEVRCPYFGEKVVFNAAGFKHVKFKSDQVARPHLEQLVGAFCTAGIRNMIEQKTPHGAVFFDGTWLQLG